MTRERLYLLDTTLRDGQQTQGVQFSHAEKVQIAEMLDDLGLDYIEGGWPGANPTDSAFFESRPKTRATFTAFGMTKRAGRSAENDEVLAAVVNAATPRSVWWARPMISTSKTPLASRSKRTWKISRLDRASGGRGPRGAV